MWIGFEIAKCYSKWHKWYTANWPLYSNKPTHKNIPVLPYFHERNSIFILTNWWKNVFLIQICFGIIFHLKLPRNKSVHTLAMKSIKKLRVHLKVLLKCYSFKHVDVWNMEHAQTKAVIILVCESKWLMLILALYRGRPYMCQCIEKNLIETHTYNLLKLAAIHQ